uniref:Uncharacterized protein n=1 Tax=Glossina austeni TaxID=7395 RepID=A0A1A9UTG2_GLOAU
MNESLSECILYFKCTLMTCRFVYRKENPTTSTYLAYLSSSSSLLSFHRYSSQSGFIPFKSLRPAHN